MKTAVRRATKRVNFMEHEDDFQVAFLGAFGLSTQAIVEMTKLSPGQVVYRLGRAEIKRADYRNGEGFAGIVINKCAAFVTGQLKQKLR